MFEKRANFTISSDTFVPLNVPKFKDNMLVDQHLKINTAEVANTVSKIATQRNAEYGKEGVPGDEVFFDLEAEIAEHPDSLYVKCFAIKADEMNDNGDYFGYEPLKEATPTFVGVPVFTNHQNSDINQARGKVVHSWWDEGRNGIMIIARVDAEAYPQLARGIREEYIMGTSMGCQVKYSLCSICHNMAESPQQYCEHIRERKTRVISAKKQKCAYHEYGKLDKCPICDSAKKDKKSFDVKDAQVFEYNYGIKFIENSFVVNPACSDCGVTEIIDPATFLAKVAELQKTLPGLLKAASNTPVICTDKSCTTFANSEQVATVLSALDVLSKGSKIIEKQAGQEQINDLNQALNLLTSVSQDMLQQKDQIDLEFLSDLVKVLADLQTVTDELTEQGYGRLPSPGQGADPNAQAQADPSQMTQAMPQTQGAPATGGASKVQTGPTGAGTVTAPTAKRKMLDLEKLSNGLLSKNKSIKSFLLDQAILKKPDKTGKNLDISFQVKKR